jgi:hypothetical protein
VQSENSSFWIGVGVGGGVVALLLVTVVVALLVRRRRGNPASATAPTKSDQIYSSVPPFGTANSSRSQSDLHSYIALSVRPPEAADNDTGSAGGDTNYVMLPSVMNH